MKIKKEDIENISYFQKEKDLFFLLLFIANDKDSVLYSDCESYLIGRCDIDYPIWIWSKDSLSKEQYSSLKKDLNHFLNPHFCKITCKKKLYDMLSLDYEVKDYFEMGFLRCEQIHKIVKKGIFLPVTYSDKVSLAKYYIENKREKDDVELSYSDSLEEISRWIDSKCFYLLKNNKGDILCMGGYSVIDKIAKITHVYTPIDKRRNGYCQYFIYELTNKLLKDGYTVILYTDYHYIPSNRAYHKVGFEDSGILINFQLSSIK